MKSAAARRAQLAVILPAGLLHCSLFFQLVLLIGSVVGQSVTNVSNGQQLADAIAAWAVSGQDATLLLTVPLISMHNVTFTKPVPNGREPYSSGQLTIAAAPDVRFTVIDGAMRGGLVPPMKGATMLLRSVGMLNSCESSLLSRNSSGSSLLSFSFLYVSTFTQNTTFYVWPSEVARPVYLPAMYKTTFAELRSIAGPDVLEPIGSTKYSWATRSAVLVKNIARSYISGMNMTVRSITDPDDPVLQSIRRQQLIMPPQYCNGTLFAPQKATARVDPLLPTIYVTNRDDWAQALVDIQGIIKMRGLPWKPAPMILINGSVVLDPNTAGRLSPPATLDYPVLITGQLSSDWQDPSIAILDFNGSTGSLQLGPSGKLYMQDMVVTGLAQQPLRSNPSLQSSLPLAAIIPTIPSTSVDGPTPYIHMHNVTVVLPQDDYLALLSLAVQDSSISSSMRATVRQLAAGLQPGIWLMAVGQIAPDWQQLSLSAFVGWGINSTTGLTFVPAQPVSITRGTSSERQCGHWRCAQLLGIVLGLGLGLMIILLLAVLLFKRQLFRPAASTPARAKPAADMVSKQDSSPVRHATSDEAERGTVGAAALQALASRLSVLVEERHSDRTQQQVAATKSVEYDDSASHQNGILLKSMDHEEIRRKAMMLNDEADKVAIASTLGKGSQGCVYKGTWRGLPVALKTVVFEDLTPSDATPDGPPAQTTRAIMEAAIACSVGHPNVVACYTYDIKPVLPMDNHDAANTLKVTAGLDEAGQSVDTGAGTYKLFLVQELCSVSLSTMIQDKLLCDQETNAVDWASLVCLMLDVAKGLAYLHTKGIIHGDLKPENVMLKVLESPQEHVRAKLTDFGLSAHLPGDATHVSGFRCGTPFYVAPEVVLHARASPASDMYSFGIIMWQCAATSNIYIKRVDGKYIWNPLFPSFISGKMPPMPYIHLMSRCLAHQPAERPTAAQAVEELQHLSMSFGFVLS